MLDAGIVNPLDGDPASGVLRADSDPGREAARPDGNAPDQADADDGLVFDELGAEWRGQDGSDPVRIGLIVDEDAAINGALKCG